MSLHYLPKSIFYVLLVLSVPAFSQENPKPTKKAEHSINFLYAFSYAADVEYDHERGQRLPGIGYQFTSKKKWYIGAEFQYDRNKKPDYAMDPMVSSGFYTYLSSQIPGGKGYFTEVSYLLNRFSIVVGDSVFKTPLDEYPVVKRLQTERYNFFLHGGKQWQNAKSELEAGFTIHGTFLRDFYALENAKFQPIAVVDNGTSTKQAYLDGIRYVTRLERSRMVPGIGLHLRYQYQIKPRLSIGIQSLATGSEEGLFLQFAPRLLYKL